MYIFASYPYIYILIYVYAYVYKKMKKIKNIGKIPEGAILVTADVIGLYPSISNKAGLEALRKRFSERDSPKVPT